jgi:16S rRNA (guanine966-N2)-methyltransferase
MRIIGGEHRGLKLATPKGREVRPILDRVRESLFGILREVVPEARVADLFAGTGVIGLEALSRGAASALFVERDPACLTTIRENLRRAHREADARVLRADAFRCADRLAEAGGFDLIFLDPPYRLLRGERDAARIEALVARLGRPDILAERGTLVLRIPSNAALPAQVAPLTPTDDRRYGGMRIILFQRP